MSEVKLEPSVAGEFDGTYRETRLPPSVAVDALPMEASNHGTYFALHSGVAPKLLPKLKALTTTDPTFIQFRQDLEQILSYRPDQMAAVGVLDQERNLQVSRLTCSLAMLSCRTDLAEESRYCRLLMKNLLADRGLSVRANQEAAIDLGVAFEPDFLNLYRAAHVKFKDPSVAGMFGALLGDKKVPLRNDPELLRLMTIICDCYQAREASALLNGLLQAHSANSAAFSKLGQQQTIVKIIDKFPEDETPVVVKAAAVFIVRTLLKGEASSLLHDMVTILKPAELKLAATKLAGLMARIPKVNPELISSMLKALRSPDGLQALVGLIEIFSPAAAETRPSVSYDAQGIVAALFDAGSSRARLRPFLQRIRGLELAGQLYERLICHIDELAQLLERGAETVNTSAVMAREMPAAARLLPLLQLGLVRYRGDSLENLVQTLNVLATTAFRDTDFDLIAGCAAEELPGSLDHLAVPESSGAAEFSGPLATAFSALWTKMLVPDDKLSGADLSRKLRVRLDRLEH